MCACVRGFVGYTATAAATIFANATTTKTPRASCPDTSTRSFIRCIRLDEPNAGSNVARALTIIDIVLHMDVSCVCVCVCVFGMYGGVYIRRTQ